MTDPAADDAPVEDLREANRKALLEQVESRIEADTDSRKSSEARAIAIISLNVGIATLYFALRSQIGLWATSIEGAAKVFLILATLLEFASLAAAVLAILPARIKLIEADAYRDFRRTVNKSARGLPRLNDEILETRIEEMAAISDVASLKARRTVRAAKFFAGAVAMFVIATVISVFSTAG